MNHQFFKILLIIILTVIFIQLSQNYNKEHFITWYLPFYNKGTKELTEGTPKYLTSDLEYNYTEYDYIPEVTFYILQKSTETITNAYYLFLFKNITKSMKIKKLYIKYEDSNDKLLLRVNENKNNFAIISSSVLVDKMSGDLEKVQNINIVIVSNYRFIFLITNKRAQISKLIEINNKRINIGVPQSDESYFGQDIINNLKINNDIEITPSYLDNEASFKKLAKGEIDGMFFTDLYPSQLLDKYIMDDIEKMLVIVPIEGINEAVFKQRNIFVEPVAIDLNALPENYLPVKVKDLEYTRYRPTLNTYRYPDFLVCNKNTEPRVSFNVVKSFVANMPVLNQSEYFLKNGYNYLAFPAIANSMFLPTHIGAKIYYNQITVNTTNPNDYCKYYVGNAKCNDEKIEGAKIVMGLENDD